MTNVQHQGATNNQYYLGKPLVDEYSFLECPRCLLRVPYANQNPMKAPKTPHVCNTSLQQKVILNMCSAPTSPTIKDLEASTLEWSTQE